MHLQIMAPVNLGGLQHTLWHNDCPACEANRSAILCGGEFSKTQTFAEAAQLFLDCRELASNMDRAQYVKPRTIRDDRQHIRALTAVFGGLPLDKFSVGCFRTYQTERSQKAGANKINQELALLKRILSRAGAWTEEMGRGYTRLKVPVSDIPRALTQEEQARFLQVAASRKRWQLLYWYSLVALQTACSSCEMRGLRLGDANLFQRLLYIRAAHAKNAFRVREIPITDQASWGLERLRERARALGATGDEHYLFPFRVSTNEWDPRRAMTEWGLIRQFHEVREAAGVPWLQGLHALRHTAITRMAEAGVAIPTIMSVAGHATRQMVEHYTHVCESAKRKAIVSTFDPGKSGMGPKVVEGKANKISR